MLGMILVGIFLVLLYICLTGNGTQIFNDVVYSDTAKQGSNKTAELVMFYLFSIAGCVIYAVFSLLTDKKVHLVDNKENLLNVKLIALASVFVIVGVHLIVYRQIKLYLLIFLTLLVICFILPQRQFYQAICFFIMSVYGICALYRLYLFLGGSRDFLSLNKIAVLSFIISFILSLHSRFKNSSAFIKGIMIFQIIIPFLLLIYVFGKYKYEMEYDVINVPNKVRIFVWLIIVMFIVEALYIIKNKWGGYHNSI